ncbi:MAG: DUF2071 domain-containing protein [Kofleriaceae bacterium]
MKLQRPDERPSGWQRWRDLLFVHWEVPVAAMRAAVPAAFELDLWEGRAIVGVVPFAMFDVRPAWLPKLFALDFLETNVRTYVRHRDRPGVYFFSLEASSLLAVKAARWGWGLPYFHAAMSLQRDGEAIAYESRRRDRAAPLHRARYTPGQMLGASQPGTFEYFLLERYLLFSIHKGVIHEGQVHHVPYPAQEVAIAELHDDLIVAAGLPAPGAPVAMHYASGVDVEVFGPWPV